MPVLLSLDLESGCDGMKLSGNTILITGGSSGIGFALAERFLELGNTVIACGRSEGKLKDAKERLPALNTFACDVSKEADRKRLVNFIKESFPGINILVNNAGIQLKVDLKKGTEELAANHEIEINMIACIYMSAEFIPLLSGKEESAIMNVSSGLGIVPRALYPIYSATKAGIRSFTKSLRVQLKDTGIKVFDIIPPLVHDTELHYGKQLERTENSVSAAELAEQVVEGMKADRYEIAAGPAKKWLDLSTNGQLEQLFQNMNR